MQTSYSAAIAFLIESGVPASRREWAMGDTIVVPLGHPSTEHGVITYPAVAWLVPRPDRSWDFITTSSLHHWIAIHCGACGSKIESDGIGPLPDKLRELELKRNGEWCVLVPRPESPKPLPGRIFHGTFAEANRLRSALLAKSINAIVEEKR
jgi:hypothetical protein